MNEWSNELLEWKLFTVQMCLVLHIYYIPVHVCVGLILVTHVIHFLKIYLFKKIFFKLGYRR